MQNWIPLFLALCLAPAARAQEAPAEDGLPGVPDVEARLVEFRSLHGERWRAQTSRATGHVEMLYGGRAAPDFVPRADADFEPLARLWVARTSGLTGLEDATLEHQRTLFLPLGQIGSGDKTTVRFRQTVRGVPVEGGFVNVLFDARGGLLSIQSTGLPRVARLDTSPALAAETALALAVDAFVAETRDDADVVTAPELVIVPVGVPKLVVGRLAWKTDVQSRPEGAVPSGTTYWVDALDGSILRRSPSVHHFDLIGTVSTLATPGTLPESVTNPATAQPARYLRVTSAAGNTTTDADGQFTIPGAAVATNVTVSYVGTFADVQNDAGVEYSLTQLVQPNTPTAILMNSPAADLVTAQANAFNHVAVLRDYVRRINPLDATADIVYVSNVNLAQTCNAFFDGTSINFYQAGNGCVNTAYSTVIAHEAGHWLNVLYGTGNGGDGMGEGNADVFAMYCYDDPIVGEDFRTNGNDIRNGNNTRQFCGDAAPACYGEVHADGEVLMGALWKVRSRLNTTLGDAPGDLVADNLFLGWMNAYDQGQIRSIIEVQWLTLDDDDGNLFNGTPHFDDIDLGFRDQGFPGYVPPTIVIDSVSDLADSTCEAGAYPVTCVVTPLLAPTIASATIVYSVDGGPPNAVPMTNYLGDHWTGAIPHLPSPARVTYYVTAEDSLTNAATFPEDAPTTQLDFTIGVANVFQAHDFDASDAGWVHASVGDTSNTQDDWQRGVPAGDSGTSQGVFWADPPGTAAGAAAWGNDLGNGSFNGAYQANIHSYLDSPPLDCSGRSNVRLRFRRWLTVEEGIYDQALVRVNGVVVWQNPSIGHLIDTSWTFQEVDLLGLADGQPAVTIRFEIQSDGGLHLGGWTVDEVELVEYLPAAACPTVDAFCAGDGSLLTACPCGNSGSAGRGCANSVNPGGGVLLPSGTTNPDTLVLTASGLPNVASVSAIFLQGDAPVREGLVFGDGVRCVDGTLVRLGAKAFPAGSCSYPEVGNQPVSVRGGVVPGSGDVRYYQTYYRNAAAAFCPPATFNVTSGLVVVW